MTTAGGKAKDVTATTQGSEGHVAPRTVSLLQDPINKGGTATVVKAYEAWAALHRPEYRPYYLDDTHAGGILRLRRWTPSDTPVPRVLPRAHVPMYRAARYKMRGIWSDIEEVHVIGAHVIHGSLAPDQAPSLVWLATLIDDERLSALEFQTRPRRLLYRATLGPLSRIEASVLSNASRVLAMSPYTADLIVERGFAPAARVEVRTVPIDTDALCPPADNVERSGLLFVGRAHDPRKGFPRIRALLDASRPARAAGVDVVSAVSPGVTEGVRWLGKVESLVDVYQKAAMLVLPSLQEGLGIVAFEALACGTPVIAYRCGGPDRMLLESAGGIVVEDATGFRSAVEELLSDPGARAEMGSAGRSFVVDNFSLQDFLADRSLFEVRVQ